MIDIAVNDLQKEYQVGQPVLTGLTFQVDTGERVGILGKNGRGRPPSSASSPARRRPTAAPLPWPRASAWGSSPRSPVYPAGYTVEDVLAHRLRRPEGDGGGQMQALSAQLAAGDPDLLARYDRLQAAFEAGGGYEIETRLEKICTGLGIDKAFRAKAFADLSGGEKTRINLARLILVDTEILPFGRAHQPPGPQRHRLAGGLRQPLQGHRPGDLPRPVLFGQDHLPGH